MFTCMTIYTYIVHTYMHACNRYKYYTNSSNLQLNLQAVGLHVHDGSDHDHGHDHGGAIVVEDYTLKMLVAIAGKSVS